MILLAS